MRRAAKILLAALVLLAALLVVNTVVTGNQTEGAEVTIEGGEIAHLSSYDLQVLDQPPANPERERGPIVLLHCYSCSLHWWDRLAPLLSERHRVIRIDLLGHGGSEKPGGGYGIDEQAAAVAETLNRLEVGPATVVGHSLGGEVAAALAERSSELVDRLAIIGTAATADSGRLPFLARLAYAPVLGEAIWTVRIPAAIKRAYESAFAPGFDFEAAFPNPDQVVEDNEAMTYTSYDEIHSALEDWLREQPLPARLTAAAVPVLAIYGAEDQLVDVAATTEQIGAVPGANVRVLDGVGHSPNVEAPDRTAELLLRFAASTRPPEPEAERRPQANRGGKRAKRKGGKQSGGKEDARKKRKQKPAGGGAET